MKNVYATVSVSAKAEDIVLGLELIRGALVDGGIELHSVDKLAVTEFFEHSITFIDMPAEVSHADAPTPKSAKRKLKDAEVKDIVAAMTPEVATEPVGKPDATPVVAEATPAADAAVPTKQSETVAPGADTSLADKARAAVQAAIKKAPANRDVVRGLLTQYGVDAIGKIAPDLLESFTSKVGAL